MFAFTKKELERLSLDTGFIQNTLEKLLRLVDILDQISRHPFLKDCFVLKGGTALNVFYHDLPRLSVDADLNYIRNASIDRMEKDREEIDKLIDVIFKKEYNVTLSKKEHALSQFQLRYETLSGSSDLIKLEINYLHRVPLIDPNIRSFNKFGLIVEFPILVIEELLGSKIIALLSRYTPRDLFDIYYLQRSKIRINHATLKQLVIYYGLVAREGIFDLFNLKLEQITERDIRLHLLPMLINRQRLDIKHFMSVRFKIEKYKFGYFPVCRAVL